MSASIDATDTLIAPGPSREDRDHSRSRTPRAGPLVVLDERSRLDNLYGPVFERLGHPWVCAHGCAPEEVLALQPSALLLTSEWTFENRLAAAAARKRDIPVIYVIDGAIEWSYLWTNLSWIRPWGTNLQPMIASDLCVLGRHQARILASLGLGTRVHVVGLPRLDPISSERILQRGAIPRIVIATSRMSGHNVEHQVMTLRALRDLRSWFAGRSDVEAVWRIPADMAEDIGVREDVAGSVSDVLARADGLISFTSTCLLEAMHKGVPAAQIEYRSVPLYVDTAWEIRCAEHIAPVVHELLYPPSSRLALQDACFADELEVGDATGRLAGVIREAIANPHPYASDSGAQPVRARGQLDYRQIYSELSAFAMSDTAVLQYELSAAHGYLQRLKGEKGLLQRECAEVLEAVTGRAAQDVRLYNFIDHLKEARAEFEPPGNVATNVCAIDGPPARVLLLHPPADLTFAVPTGAPGRISFAISMHPDIWTHPQSGPCQFLIQVDGAPAFDATIDLLADPADRKWWWFEAPVPEAPGGSHVITFSTRGVNETSFRWALWRNPVFLWADTTGQPATAGFRARCIGQADYYVPGRTLA
ncbi:MAG: hypothetical protein HZC55_10300 [Verrucomicrobia bacterium]|nr:hypothetical protein [Verrucomicrobiota bacterium]